MATADDVVVEFEARVGKYKADLRSAEQAFQRTTGVQEARMAAFERRMVAGAGKIGAALAGILTVATAREFLRLVDAGKQVEAQLRLATRESGSFAKAQEDVRRIAMTNRSGLEETARLYGNFQRNAEQLGITQEEAARATETVGKAFLISGASAMESSQGIRQLVQGLQSGVLRGDEFNSIMEAAPRLSKLFAASLGVTQGELRKMAEAGELTAAKLTDALTNGKFTKGIDEEFQELPVTFDQAMQQVENAAIITFGAFDRGGGFSTMLANFITDGVNGFAGLENAAIETGIDIRSSFEGLASAFQPLIDAAHAAFGEIGGEAQTLASEIRNLLGGLDNILNFQPGEPGAVERWIDRNIWGVGPSNTLGAFNERQAQSEQERRRALGQGPLARAQAAMMEAYQQSTAGPGRATPSPTKPTKRTGPSAETLARRAEQQRLNAIRDEASNQQDLAGLNDDILAARAAMARAADDILQFELQQIGREKDRRLEQYRTEVKLGELTQAEYEQRVPLVEEEARLRGQALLLRKAEVDAARSAARQAREADDAISTLQAESQLARTRKERAEVEGRILELAYEEEERAIRRAAAEAAAQGEAYDLDTAIANMRRRKAADEEGLRRDTQGPLGRYLDETADPRELAEEAAVRELQSVRDGLAEGLTEQLGIKNQFVKDLVGIFLDQVLFRPLAEGLSNAGGGGLGGLLNGGLAAIFGGGYAAGGGFGGGTGGRAIGGPVRAGTPYKVGENGQELFVPQQNGIIVPNHRLQGQSGGGSTFISARYDLRGAMVTEEVLAEMDRRSRKHAAEAGGAAYKQAMKDTPGRVKGFQRYGK